MIGDNMVEEPKLIYEDDVECPVCGGKTLKYRVYTYVVPLAGEIIMEVWKCDTCGYRKSNVGLTRVEKAKRLKISVNTERELKTLVIKSSTARIEIPELGIEIIPGPAAEGYITTVEGVLERILDNIPAECFNESHECHNVVVKIVEAMNAKLKFTLILEDPLGRSALIGEGVTVVEEPIT